MKFTILNEMAIGTTYDPFNKANQERAKRDAINLAKRQKSSVGRRKARMKGEPVGELKFLFLRDGDVVKSEMTVDEILQEEGGYDFLFAKSDAGFMAGKAAFEAMTDLQRYVFRKQQESFARR